MINIVNSLLVVSAVALGTTQAVAVSPSTYVEYSGDTLPELSAQPFEYHMDAASGSSSVANGILKINNTSASGSLGYERSDQFLVGDDAVFQFRTRLVSSQTSSSTRPGSVVWVRWVGDTPGQFLFFADNGFIRLKEGGPFSAETSIPFDTSAFHTYSIVKLGQQSIQLFVDGELALSRPFSNFRLTDLGPQQTGAFEQFQGNPRSTTEWDFFRYAIGNDALALIPVPEPISATMLGTALLGMVAARRRRV